MIKPEWITMDALEYRADELRSNLKEHLGSALDFGFDTESYLDFLVHSDMLSYFDFTNQEGLCEEILGKFDVINNSILIFNGMQNKARENFTVAHEIGHCILHRPMFLRQNPNFNNSNGEYKFSFDLHRDIVDGKRVPQTANKKIDTLEMQANNFARYLLMPRDNFTSLAHEYMDRFKIIPDYFSNLSNIRFSGDFQKLHLLVNALSDMFNTSRSACTIRLKNTGVLDKNFKVV